MSPSPRLSWLYLLRHTVTPSGRPLASYHASFEQVVGWEDLDEATSQGAWTSLVGLLLDECPSRSR